jgi:hypothetical protein
LVRHQQPEAVPGDVGHFRRGNGGAKHG